MYLWTLVYENRILHILQCKSLVLLYTHTHDIVGPFSEFSPKRPKPRRSSERPSTDKWILVSSKDVSWKVSGGTNILSSPFQSIFFWLMFQRNWKKILWISENKSSCTTPDVGLVMDRVPKTWVWGLGGAVEKWVKGKLNKAFLHHF